MEGYQGNNPQGEQSARKCRPSCGNYDPQSRKCTYGVNKAIYSETMAPIGKLCLHPEAFPKRIPQPSQLENTSRDQ